MANAIAGPRTTNTEKLDDATCLQHKTTMNAAKKKVALSVEPLCALEQLSLERPFFSMLVYFYI